MLKNGAHPKIVQRPGHASITTTMDTYSHVLPKIQAEAIVGFDNILGREQQRLVSNCLEH